MKDNKVFTILKSAIAILFVNKVIFLPFLILGFIQVFIIEIIYFTPRWPLNVVFDPLVKTFWSEIYIHYPNNFILLPFLFQISQMPLFIFISGFFIGSTVLIIRNINSDKKINLKEVYKEVLSSYIHIVMAMIVSFLLTYFLIKLYGLVMGRALLIRSESGPFYWLKKIVIDGSPFFNLLINTFVFTFFAYVIPNILIEKKKVFLAIWLNIRMVFKSFFATFFIVFIPYLLIIPILILRKIITIETFFPELTVYTLILSVVVMTFIMSVVYTALTIFYLVNKEEK